MWDAGAALAGEGASTLGILGSSWWAMPFPALLVAFQAIGAVFNTMLNARAWWCALGNATINEITNWTRYPHFHKRPSPEEGAGEEESFGFGLPPKKRPPPEWRNPFDRGWAGNLYEYCLPANRHPDWDAVVRAGGRVPPSLSTSAAMRALAPLGTAIGAHAGACLQATRARALRLFGAGSPAAGRGAAPGGRATASDGYRGLGGPADSMPPSGSAAAASDQSMLS